MNVRFATISANMVSEMSDNGPDDPTQSMPADGDEPVPGSEAEHGVPGEPSIFADSFRPSERSSDATSALTASEEPVAGEPPSPSPEPGPIEDDEPPIPDWMQPETEDPAAGATSVMGSPEAPLASAVGAGAYGPGGPHGGGGDGDGPGGPFDDGPLEPEEPLPWYRQRGPMAALIAGLAALVMIIIAIIVLAGGDDDEVEPEPDTSSTIVDTTPPPTVASTTAPSTAPPTTRPAPTTVATTPPPTTPPPTTAPATTPPPTTQPPTTTLPPTTTQPPTTTAPPTTAPPTTAAVSIPPQEDPTVFDILSSSPALSRARGYVEDADLRDALDDPEQPLTFLAPTNDAFELVEQSPGGEELLNDEDALEELLLRHIVESPLSADEIFSNDVLQVVNGDELAVDRDAETIEDASIVAADLEDGGGIVHAIDLVLLPEGDGNGNGDGGNDG